MGGYTILYLENTLVKYFRDKAEFGRTFPVLKKGKTMF